jgi:hypothetical protein
MRKLIITVSTVAAFAVSAYAGGAIAAPGDQADRQPQYFAENAKAFTNARIAALKAGLELKPDQEKNWTALETTLRDLAKQHDDQFAKWRAQNKDDGDQRRDALQRLQLISDRLATQAADLKALATAATPLYNSLDDAQKSRFGHLLRAASFGGGPHGDGPGEHHWRHAEAEHPDGPGGPEGGPTFE